MFSHAAFNISNNHKSHDFEAKEIFIFFCNDLAQLLSPVLELYVKPQFVLMESRLLGLLETM